MAVADDGSGRRPDRTARARPSADPAPAGPPPAFDLRLAVRAGLNGLVFVAPAAVIGLLIADDDGEVSAGPALAIAAVQILGFCFSGWVVRRLRPGSSVATCAAAGVACWAILQAVGVATTLARGDEVQPLRWIATLLVAALAAAAGGLLARFEPATVVREDP
ncbi:MAG: hypothetical protein GXY13_07015 [Acidimicrobiales bacterium]|nr:hypothetical protein [Acidimicrobiales bacterium]